MEIPKPHFNQPLLLNSFQFESIPNTEDNELKEAIQKCLQQESDDNINERKDDDDIQELTKIEENLELRENELKKERDLLNHKNMVTKSKTKPAKCQLQDINSRLVHIFEQIKRMDNKLYPTHDEYPTWEEIINDPTKIDEEAKRRLYDLFDLKEV